MTEIVNESGAIVYIVGTGQFQSELLANYIESELELACSVTVNSMELCGVFLSNCHGKLVLCDCQNLTVPEIWSKYVSFISPEGRGGSSSVVALVNLEYNLSFGVDALAKGVKGLFYANDSLKTLKKGVMAILKGELWFSRETMTKSLLLSQKKNQQGTLNTVASILTPREKEILTMVALGSTNIELSNSLNISPHTVKTHINNIFRKIHVPNRVQAVLWATKHLA